MWIYLKSRNFMYVPDTTMFLKTLVASLVLVGSLASSDVTVQHAVDGNVLEALRAVTSQMMTLTSRMTSLEGLVVRQESVIARHEATIRDQAREIQELKGKGPTNVNTKRSVQARNVISKFAFSAYLSNDVTGMSGNQTIVFDTTLLNEGNAYNPQDGTFYAQVGGVYLFSFVVNTYKDLALWVKLVVNDVTMAHNVIWPHFNPSANMQGRNVVLLRLQRGDRVWVATELQNYGTDVHGGDNVRATTFSGVFLYE